MKRYTTRFLKIVALIYMAFPLTHLLVATLLFDVPGEKCASILLMPSYLILSVFAIAAGWGFWEMKRWSWYVFLATNVFQVYVNAVIVSNYGQSNHKILAFVLSAFVILGLLMRVSREVRVPYFLPKIRWWESNPRYRLVVPVKLLRSDQTQLEGDILDLSMGGCFVKLRADVVSDEALDLDFTIFGIPIQCPGVVVWRTQSAVTHPKGIGVKFGPMPRSHRKTLRAVNQRLKAISNLYRSSRFLMNQEEFFKKMEKLQTEGIELRVKTKG